MKDTKQVIVMRKDLNMRKGKMIAQGSHASLKAITDQMNKKTTFEHICDSKDKQDTWSLYLSHDLPLYQWFESSFKKICVYVKSEEELLDIHKKTLEENIPVALIEDNGLTEFKGVKTKTCLAIGPYWSEDIDKITKHLPLL